jgi:hypothetical protein
METIFELLYVKMFTPMIIPEVYNTELATGCYEYLVITATHQHEEISLILLSATCSKFYCNNNLQIMDGLLKDNYKITVTT